MIGRCQTCKHWGEREDYDYNGMRVCTASPNDFCIPLNYDGMATPQRTRPDYGCVLHLPVAVMGESTIQ